MTKKAFEKIEGTIYKTTLDYKKTERKNLEERGFTNAAKEIANSIAGYVQALRDCGVITESERRTLFLYYATM
jgi:ribosomal protein S17E